MVHDFNGYPRAFFELMHDTKCAASKQAGKQASKHTHARVQ